jgi:hypothetical protein
VNVRGFLPRHQPQPHYFYDYNSIKRARRMFLESGLTAVGCPYNAPKIYHPVNILDRDSEWKQNTLDPDQEPQPR